MLSSRSLNVFVNVSWSYLLDFSLWFEFDFEPNRRLPIISFCSHTLSARCKMLSFCATINFEGETMLFHIIWSLRHCLLDNLRHGFNILTEFLEVWLRSHNIPRNYVGNVDSALWLLHKMAPSVMRHFVADIQCDLTCSSDSCNNSIPSVVMEKKKSTATDMSNTNVDSDEEITVSHITSCRIKVLSLNQIDGAQWRQFGGPEWHCSRKKNDDRRQCPKPNCNGHITKITWKVFNDYDRPYIHRYRRGEMTENEYIHIMQGKVVINNSVDWDEPTREEFRMSFTVHSALFEETPNKFYPHFFSPISREGITNEHPVREWLRLDIETGRQRPRMMTAHDHRLVVAVLYTKAEALCYNPDCEDPLDYTVSSNLDEECSHYYHRRCCQDSYFQNAENTIKWYEEWANKCPVCKKKTTDSTNVGDSGFEETKEQQKYRATSKKSKSSCSSNQCVVDAPANCSDDGDAQIVDGIDTGNDGLSDADSQQSVDKVHKRRLKESSAECSNVARKHQRKKRRKLKKRDQGTDTAEVVTDEVGSRRRSPRLAKKRQGNQSQ